MQLQGHYWFFKVRKDAAMSLQNMILDHSTRTNFEIHGLHASTSFIPVH